MDVAGDCLLIHYRNAVRWGRGGCLSGAFVSGGRSAGCGRDVFGVDSVAQKNVIPVVDIEGILLR